VTRDREVRGELEDFWGIFRGSDGNEKCKQIKYLALASIALTLLVRGCGEGNKK
jgi:hypothetical protein